MKTPKAILSITALLAVIVFLSASTGITLITHSCELCGDSSVRAGIFIAPVEPEDDCCEAADHCSGKETSRPEDEGFKCCHFSIEKLKLTNFAASSKISVQPLWDATPLLLSEVHLNYTSRPEAVIFAVRNKHGGRDIIALNCQLLS